MGCIKSLNLNCQMLVKKYVSFYQLHSSRKLCCIYVEKYLVKINLKNEIQFSTIRLSHLNICLESY